MRAERDEGREGEKGDIQDRQGMRTRNTEKGKESLGGRDPYIPAHTLAHLAVAAGDDVRNC